MGDYDSGIDHEEFRGTNTPVEVCGKMYDQHVDENFNVGLTSDASKANVREKAIISEALRWGTNAGLSYRYNVYIKTLRENKIQAQLDQAFNFKVLSYDFMLMPPVIAEAGKSIEVRGGGRTAVSTSNAWEIVKDAALVTQPPTWRNYLLRYNFEYDTGEVTPALQPQSGRERTLWKKYLCRGVVQGFRQADRTFRQSFAQLTRDFKGMLLFRRLNLQGVVNKPIVEHSLSGTVTNGKILWVDKQNHRISKPTSFRMPKNWKAPIILIRGRDVK